MNHVLKADNALFCWHFELFQTRSTTWPHSANLEFQRLIQTVFKSKGHALTRSTEISMYSRTLGVSRLNLAAEKHWPPSHPTKLVFQAALPLLSPSPSVWPPSHFMWFIFQNSKAQTAGAGNTNTLKGYYSMEENLTLTMKVKCTFLWSFDLLFYSFIFFLARSEKQSNFDLCGNLIFRITVMKCFAGQSIGRYCAKSNIRFDCRLVTQNRQNCSQRFCRVGSFQSSSQSRFLPFEKHQLCNVY